MLFRTLLIYLFFKGTVQSQVTCNAFGKIMRISKFKKDVGCVVSHFTHLFVFQGKSAKLGCM